MIRGEGNIVVVQALLGGAMPGGCPWSCNERQVRTASPTPTSSVTARRAKSWHAWIVIGTTTAINAIKASVL